MNVCSPRFVQHLEERFSHSMVTLLTIQILSIAATTITNFIGILAFSTDYWSVIVYDLAKLRSYTQWIVFEDIPNGDIRFINNTNETELLAEIENTVFGFDKNLLLYKIHKGIFRQCNYLSANIRMHLSIPMCQALKSTNNRYDDLIHGIINPGRELIRKYESMPNDHHHHHRISLVQVCIISLRHARY